MLVTQERHSFTSPGSVREQDGKLSHRYARNGLPGAHENPKLSRLVMNM
jgi:hypothetical protein